MELVSFESLIEEIVNFDYLEDILKKSLID